MLAVTRRVVGVLDDLFFTVKIQDAVKRAGLAAVFVQDEERALALAMEHPTLMIVDLNAKTVNAVKLIHKLKHMAETKPVSVIGFVSHVQLDLKNRALEAGADSVLPRSAFSQNLPTILRRHADALKAAGEPDRID